MLDNEQVKLTLTNDPEVLNALRRRKVLLPSENGGELFELMFDSSPISFRIMKTGERTIVPCSGRMAKALLRDSATLIGDPLTGDYKHSLVAVGSYKLTEGDPALRMTKTTCPFCKLETADARKLARHLLAECKHPDAGVPNTLAAIEEEKAAKAKSERQRNSGLNPAEAAQVLSVPANTVREDFVPAAAPTQSHVSDESETMIEDETV